MCSRWCVNYSFVCQPLECLDSQHCKPTINTKRDVSLSCLYVVSMRLIVIVRVKHDKPVAERWLTFCLNVSSSLKQNNNLASSTVSDANVEILIPQEHNWKFPVLWENGNILLSKTPVQLHDASRCCFLILLTENVDKTLCKYYQLINWVYRKKFPIFL